MTDAELDAAYAELAASEDDEDRAFTRAIRDRVMRLWADDWDSPEDSAYDN